MLIAAVQFTPIHKNVRSNLNRMVSLVEEAVARNAELIVFPELATTGYTFFSKGEAEPYAEILQYPKHPDMQNRPSSLQIFRALALKYKIYIVWGTMEKSAATGALFNSQVMVCPDGTFETYAKINSFGSDWCWTTSGRANPPIRKELFKGKEYKIGLLICRDIRDKFDSEWNDFYAPGDADIVCLSTAWGKSAFPATAWMDFVKSNKTALIVSNRCGVEIPHEFGYGGVCIINKDLTVQLEGLKFGVDCIVYGTVG